MLMSWLSCATDTPSAAGAMSRQDAPHAPDRAGSHRGRGSMRDVLEERDLEESWATPPKNTAHASATMGRSKCGAAKTAKAMNETLSSTGVNAGALNAP